jgi:NADPH-dependent 2,4-dienoyl-CoA reductase/sulfur reductase-like enzyme
VTPDVVVVGGGAVGLCCALELARAGASVRVLEREAELARNTLLLLRNYETADYMVQALENVDLDGKLAAVVAVTDNRHNQEIRLFIDLQANLLLRKGYHAALMGGPPADIEEVYADYREASGIKVPYKITLMAAGEKRLEITVHEVKFNTGVDDSVFSKP